MNVHITLEDDCIDTRMRKDNLLVELNKYPFFRETSLKEAEYLIIISNYPMSGKQNFNKSLEDLILCSDHIGENKTLLLDFVNCFYLLDEETPTYKGVHFLEEIIEIEDIFGLNPEQVREQECSDWQNPPLEKDNTKIKIINVSDTIPNDVLGEVKKIIKTTKKRRLLLG